MIKPLTTYIREAVEADPEGEPEVIAQAVLDALPSRKIRHYMLDLLTSRVKDMLRLDGNAARSAALSPVRGGVTRSPKYAERQMLSNLWQQMLDGRINIGGTWQRFGSCTRDELMQCVKERREDINQIHNQIDNIEHVIALMDEYDVATPDDLPEQEVA